MFYVEKEFEQTSELLQLAQQRLESAKQGERGLALLGSISEVTEGKPRLWVGGFRSQLDDGPWSPLRCQAALWRLASSTKSGSGLSVRAVEISRMPGWR